MPVYTIPKAATGWAVVRGKDGTYAVASADRLVFIPCRDQPQAELLRDQLDRGEHDGTVRVDLL